MDFRIKATTTVTQKSGCLIIAGFDNKKLSATANKLPKSLQASLKNAYQQGDFDGKLGDTLLLHATKATRAHGTGMGHERLLLVGCGSASDMTEANYRKAVRAATLAVKKTGAKDAWNCLAEITVKGRDYSWKVRQLVETSEDALYVYNQTKSGKPSANATLKRIIISAGKQADVSKGNTGLKQGKAIAGGVSLAKTLGNLPGNICTPGYLASAARKLGRQHAAITVKVLDEKAMKKLGMGSLLSVSRGSRQPARLIILEYKGGKKSDKPRVLVGKGLTFDAGGISIKPAAAMDEMKYDMCGGASVLGTLSAVASMKLPLNVVGIVPSSENLPDGDANKPGDIVTSMSGQTIEILNTDAEGRLILCDALTYAERYKPASVIDIATLTGACVIALGKHPSGLLSNHQPLANEILDAGNASGDRAWQMPLWDDYQDQLKSNFADMANIGGREAGTITAACFLSRYTKKYHWAHLDIAGTAWKSGAKKGATGRPVALLSQYLINKCAKKK